MHAEAVVLPRRRARLGQEILQPLLAVGGQPVDNFRAAPGQGIDRAGQGFLDQALAQQFLQARVQGSVPEGTERAEQRVEPLASS